MSLRGEPLSTRRASTACDAGSGDGSTIRSGRTVAWAIGRRRRSSFLWHPWKSSAWQTESKFTPSRRMSCHDRWAEEWGHSSTVSVIGRPEIGIPQ